MNIYLSRLEKSHTTWFLITTFLLFFFLRFPSLVEPYWYGDEGIYEVIGIALRHGRMLYSGIWDNKPPLLYLTYALFNSDQFMVRLASLLVGLGATCCFFFLARKLFQQKKIVYTATIIFCLLFATPIAEGNIANAENFMLLPIIAAGLLIYNLSTNLVSQKKQNPNSASFLLSTNSQPLFLSGLLLSIAFLYKIVALFDFTAFAVFLICIYTPEKIKLKSLCTVQTLQEILPPIIPYVLGFVLPIAVTILYFVMKGSGNDFFHAIFASNIGYVGYANVFIIPQGLLLLKLVLLTSIVLFLFTQRRHVPSSALFILVWFSFELFDSFFSQRNYTHYFLMLLPSLSLLVGLPILLSSYRYKQYVYSGVIVLAALSILYFLYGRYNLLPYYENFFGYISNQESVTAYQSFFDSKTPRDYMIADYLKLHTKPYEPIFIWGNSAQIYVLSNTLPPGRYTVAYQAISNKQTLEDTIQTLNNVKPRYIIILGDSPNLPYSNVSYGYKISLGGNTVYERMGAQTLSR